MTSRSFKKKVYIEGIKCPKCRNNEIIKHGNVVNIKTGEKNTKYWCDECDYNFTKPERYSIVNCYNRNNKTFTLSIYNHSRKSNQDTFKVFCLYCDKTTPHIDMPYIPFADRKIKCTICGEDQFNKDAIYTSRNRS